MNFIHKKVHKFRDLFRNIHIYEIIRFEFLTNLEIYSIFYELNSL